MENRNPADLIPYANNAKTHSDEQITAIAASIKEFGFNAPVLIDGENGIIAGHGRIRAAIKLKLDEVPVVELTHLTPAQKKAYILADNRLGEIGTDWNLDLVSVELESIAEMGKDYPFLDFDEFYLFDGEGEAIDTDGTPQYTRKIEPPIYEIKGEKPAIKDLYNSDKTKELLIQISESKIPADVKAFLSLAAERHTVFNFANIAEYYAHAEPEIQALMENSAMIIIDYDSAIEGGFIQMSEAIAENCGKDYPDA